MSDARNENDMVAFFCVASGSVLHSLLERGIGLDSDNVLILVSRHSALIFPRRAFIYQGDYLY